MTTQVVAVSEADVSQTADLLARVFQADPMMRFLVADEARMLDKPARFYRACIRMGLRYGVVEATPSLDGLAIWIRPGETDFSLAQMVRSGLAAAAVGMGLTTLRRFISAQGPTERARKEGISGPHWYLMFLAVDPAVQGRGLGGALIQPGLARADADGVPCFLDSTSQRNLTFYERHGFSVAAEGQIPGGPRFWAMRRNPPAADSPLVASAGR